MPLCWASQMSGADLEMARHDSMEKAPSLTGRSLQRPREVGQPGEVSEKAVLPPGTAKEKQLSPES